MHCPKCKKEGVWEGNPHRPFCSRRCKLLDLGCWFDEVYRLEGTDEDSEFALPEGGGEEQV